MLNLNTDQTIPILDTYVGRTFFHWLRVPANIELADVVTGSREWECWWVGELTSWIKLTWSRSERNWVAFELDVSSTWILKSPVMTNFWGKVQTIEMRILESSRNWEKVEESQDFAVNRGGQ